jgi:hypothetical protein
VAVVHTAFDVAPGGAADALGDSLGLEDPKGFGPAWPAESVKFAVFVPEDHAGAVIDAMAGAGAGVVGAYTRCAFRVAGEGMFVAPPEASPAVGVAGEPNTEPEMRVEMVAPADRADAVAAALLSAHPYEEPAFDVVPRRGDAGMVGRIGGLPDRPTVGDLARLVSERLGGVVRVAGATDATVGRAAVVPGSGGDLVGTAADAGADAVVTGDVSHHRARAALERGVAVVDPGHIATERPGLERLYAAVAEAAGGAVDLRRLDPDPWRAG